MYSMLQMCQFNSYYILAAEYSALCRLTIKPVDTHHKVYAIIKLLIVFLGGEVG